LDYTGPYELDSETQELIQTVFELAQGHIDSQLDDVLAEDLQTILVETAERLGIATHRVEYETSVDEDGATNITIRREPKGMDKPRWRPRIIDGSKGDKPEQP
jgi:hypothetical protein